MLCDLCFRMLRRQDGRIWKGTWDLHFKHHNNIRNLQESAAMHCGICRVLWSDLKDKLDKDGIDLNNMGTLSPVPRSEIFSVTASLSILNHPLSTEDEDMELYRLDFKLRFENIRSQRTFVLRKTSTQDPPFRTPLADSTSSDEVLQLVIQWISDCKCVSKPPSWYPRRLLDLKKLKTQDFFDLRKLASTGQKDRKEMEKERVFVVERESANDWSEGKPKHGNQRYVTLSHCWGPEELRPITLTPENIHDFTMNGITLADLPKTFRDAIEFAARLEGVGYIWIDSLCIMQGNSQESRKDWLAESAVMGRVYRESYLNISATAARDSTMGLFFPREAQLLLEDEIALNIDGIPGAHQRPSRSHSWHDKARRVLHPKTAAHSGNDENSAIVKIIQSVLRFSAFPFNLAYSYVQAVLYDPKRPPSPQPELSPVGQEPHPMDVSISNLRDNESSNRNLRRCIILDVSLWKDLVDEAPVNKRGWVLQERLLAPRVLHFCGASDGTSGQVAWECTECNAAEGYPSGVPNFQLTSDGTLFESRTLKGLGEHDGKRLREMRLKGFPDPVPHLRPQIYAFELWRRMVEVYSRTAISQSEDKLIALSGIARLMSAKIGSNDKHPARYCAGLWRPLLESQLLWKTEPVFQEGRNVDLQGDFYHETTRPRQYRAPSFSWASIDTENGNGIVYGEVTDTDLLIKVEDVQVTLGSDNEYGLVKDGKLVLWGHLRRVELIRKDRGRFGWHTLDRGDGLDAEEHTNVYLDCPGRDVPGREFRSILGHDAEIFVLPAAKTEGRQGNEDSKYLTCLLLQKVDTRSEDDGDAVFRRIGLTKLSSWADKYARAHILDVHQRDIAMPCNDYDKKAGHKIVIV
ncbi:HET-domain-containing protein [Lophiostoma macrostomum CBS 122681]|uniref:HET-domain-containing protein n=1 Tax=Lophiostoma macrostomum CBS 122681 TaxID=1314788 RepID=A0A6A6SPV6_9PLEO|nr:HET-domain-containing protein [Lophiostoma macrostomum CBS 122681]